MHRQLDDKTLVAGQIRPEDVPALKELGVTLIVNNRPDFEDAGQPEGDDIEAMREAMHSAGDGKLFAFCRSGNRSTLAWAVARSEDGVSSAELNRMANEAGFDLGPVAHLIGD